MNADKRLGGWVGLIAHCMCGSSLLFSNVDEGNKLRADDSSHSFASQVKSLVSKNHEPVTSPRNVKLPEGFDHHEIIRVKASWDALVAAGPRAFPAIADGLKDDRYSVTVYSMHSEMWVNHTVADVCYYTLKYQVDPWDTYDIRESVDVRSSIDEAWLNDNYKNLLADWASSASGKSLIDLQRESLRTVIEFLSTGKGARQKGASDVAGRLAQILDDLNQSKKAIVPKRPIIHRKLHGVPTEK